MTPAEATPAELVASHFKLKADLEAIQKVCSENCKPYQVKLEEVHNEMLKFLNANGGDSFSTDDGTMYKSVLLKSKIVDKDKFVDACLDDWDGFGAEALLVSAKIDEVRKYMEEHNGTPPPGIETDFFTRVNVRRT
jgi:hypothetical protein